MNNTLKCLKALAEECRVLDNSRISARFYETDDWDDTPILDYLHYMECDGVRGIYGANRRHYFFDVEKLRNHGLEIEKMVNDFFWKNNYLGKINLAKRFKWKDIDDISLILALAEAAHLVDYNMNNYYYRHEEMINLPKPNEFLSRIVRAILIVMMVPTVIAAVIRRLALLTFRRKKEEDERLLGNMEKDIEGILLDMFIGIMNVKV